jgi:MoaA/NifB/PqqE/SkfB family radical SAM enzyme
MTWKYEDIDSVNIEISSLCNAICAWCPRYEDMSNVVNKQLTQTYVTIDQFKEWFPPDFVSRIKTWVYSGDYGDAGTNPDLPEIFRYTFKHNPEASVQVNTNGGMRNPKFWAEMGEIFSETEQRKVIFSIDGLEDTNHIYRRNVNWQKVMDNVDAYIGAGGTAIWDFLTFKHNEHQVRDAILMSKELGFSDINIKLPKGFEGGNMKVKDKDFNIIYEIEPIDTSHFNLTYPKLNGLKAEDVNYETVRDSIESHFSKEEGKVSCFSKRSGVEIRITADGVVYPCVHFGHLSQYPRENLQVPKTQMIDIFKDKEINLHKKSLEEILSTDPFKWVYESWKKKSCMLCWLSCGHNDSKETVIQEIFQREGMIHGTS